LSYRTPAGDTAEVVERFDVPLKERFLGLGAVGDVERPAGVAQPHTNIHTVTAVPGDHDLELAEVDLGLRARGVDLRDEHLPVDQPELDTAGRDIPRHRHLRDLRAVLGHQPLPHPPRGMPLLPRDLLVGDQPAVDDLPPRIERPGPNRILPPGWRHRRGERLPHRPPVHPMGSREFADRHARVHALVPPDLFEQLHPGPLPHQDLHADNH